MKKFLITSLALVCGLLTSCTKEEVAVETDVMEITFISAKPQFDNDTKTAWETDHVVWKAGDKIRIACLQDGTTWRGADLADTKARAYATEPLEKDCDVATFKLAKNGSNSFGELTNGSFVFYSTYPYYSSSAEFKSEIVKYSIPASQTVNANTFDAAKDVLVAKSETLDPSVTLVDKSVDLKMFWKRVVAHTLLSLNALPIEDGEIVTSIKLSAQEDAQLVGDFNCDITSGEIDMAAAPSQNVVSVNGNIAVSGGSVKTWFTTIPENVTSLKIEFTTNGGATYSREISSCNVNFVSNKRNVMNVDMSTATLSEDEGGETGGEDSGSETQPLIVEFGNLGYESWGKKESFSGSTYDALSQTKDNVVFDYVRGNGSTYANTSATRFYKDNKLTFTVPDGFVLTSIVFTGSSFKADVTTNVATCTSSTSGLSWSGNSETVTFTRPADASNYVTLNSVKVTLAAANPAKKLTAIQVNGTPTELWKGDTFNHNGITISALWDDDTKTDVTADCEFSGFDMATAGEQTITVAYQGKTATYTINVQTIANTEETAYTVTEAKSVIDAGHDLATEVFVTGTISKVDSYNSTYGSITYWISEDGTTEDQFEVYGGLGIDKTKFTSKDDLSVGDEVVVKGQLKKYVSDSKVTYELGVNNVLISRTPAPSSDITATLSIEDITVNLGESIEPEIVTNVPAGSYNITYVSSNPSVVVVNSDNTLSCTEVSGSSNITATLSAEGYTTVTTTFKVVVNKTVDPENPDDGEPKTVEFVFKDMGYSNAQTLDLVSKDGISISFDKGENSTAPAYYDTGFGVRVYAGSSMTISGGTITRIEITYSASSYAGSIVASPAGYELSSSVGTWTGSANSVSFTRQSENGHVRIQKIVVTYSLDGDGGDPNPGGGSGEEETPGTGGGTTYTATINVSSITSGLSTGDTVSSFDVDENVSVSAIGVKYYETNSVPTLRAYQSSNSKLTFKTASGYEFEEMTITYTVSNKGVLQYNYSNIVSGTAFSVTGSTVVLNVANTGTATNGQANISSITVKYKKASN